VIVSPATATVAVRADPLFPSTFSVSEPLPVPLAGDVM
jgi:hypothetical protein